MTKAELLKALEKYDTDAEIVVLFDGEDCAVTKVSGTWDVAEDGFTKIDSTRIAFIEI